MTGISKRVQIAALVFSFANAATAGEWKLEQVDQTGVGRSSSMKIDKQGNGHVAYVVVDGNRNPLKYGFRDHRLNRWYVMTVAESAGSCSLVLDSKQRPHISYVDYGSASGAKLRYTYWDGSAWKKQVLPLNSDIIAYYSSIVLDANDNPSISFYEYRGPRGTEIKIRLRVVMWNGQQWQVRTVDGQEGSGKFNAMAIDAAGTVHIAYANVSSGTEGMRYGRWDGKSWKLEVVESTAEALGYSASISLDREGNPHLVYSNASSGVVKYAVKKNGQWKTENVDRISAVGYPDRNSIAIDEDGRPYLGYYDAGRGTLNLAHKEGDRWRVQVLDDNAAGFASSLQIDRGIVWISYSDEGNGGLKVARSEPASSTRHVPSDAGKAVADSR